MMKIAICCEQNSPDSETSLRFGRAPWIGIYDDASGNWEFVANSQNLNAAQGAGIQTAQNILNCEADVVLTDNLGPKAMRVLRAAQVSVFQIVKGQNLGGCIEMYKNNELAIMEESNVEGHWV